MTEVQHQIGAARVTPGFGERTGMEIRRTHFSSEIVFHAPGLKRYHTREYTEHNAAEFVPISLTGTACAQRCDHCNALMLRGMVDLTRSSGSLFDLCARLANQGAKGVLITGGSDRQGRVHLVEYIPDLTRARRELGLALRVHPGLPDEETCAALATIGLDGAMVDIIGHADTIQQVYHLDKAPDDYEAVLARLERHGIPTIPHIILGLHYGRWLGEWHALEIIARHPPKVLVLVILLPLAGTRMQATSSPDVASLGDFFLFARRALPAIPILLGCARPMGLPKLEIDRLAIDAGLNGIAYPADGIVTYAREQGLEPRFINACCGMNW